MPVEVRRHCLVLCCPSTKWILRTEPTCSVLVDSLFLLSYLIDPQSLLELSHVHLLTLFFFDTCGVLVVIDNLMIFRITQVSKPQCVLWGAFRSGLADLNVVALE